MCCLCNRNTDYVPIRDNDSNYKAVSIYLIIFVIIFGVFSIPNILGIYLGSTYTNFTCTDIDVLATSIIASSIINIIVTGGLFVLFAIVFVQMVCGHKREKNMKWFPLSIYRFLITIFYITYMVALINYLYVSQKHAFDKCTYIYPEWEKLYYQTIVNICYPIFILIIVAGTVSTNIFYGCLYILLCCCTMC